MESSQQLTALLIWPMLAGLIAWFVPKASQRLYAIFMAAVQLGLSIFIAAPVVMKTGSGFEQTLPWLSELGIQLQLKLDEVSVWFVLLSSFVSFVALGMKGQWYRRNSRLFTSMAFFLVFAINTAFMSSNLIVFYLAYEAVFIPMILMVGVWGSNTKAASVFRFFLMSFFGSVLMLVSIFYLSYLHFQKTGSFSANLSDLIQLQVSGSAMYWCFAGFFLAFAIKVPLFPFHGWLKDVYVNAPTPATIWMSAILSKLGVYGFIRFVGPLFPEAQLTLQGALLAVAAFTVIYSAFLAIQTKDPKGLLAYSSISHLGFVMLGVFSLSSGGRTSSILLSVSHGLTSTVLFYLYDQIVERKEDVSLDQYSGLAKKYPLLFTCTFFGVLASVSLPGTFNFVGEFMVLIHAYPVSALCTILAGLGVIFGAVYMLKFYQRLGFGASDSGEASSDLSGFDLILVVLILLMILYFGFQPSIFLGGMSNV
jgi:NADH-quinone oxidoreductase subunit M